MIKTPSPPKHLQKPGRALFRQIVAEYGIVDAGGVALLTTACECLDRARQAQAELARDGIMVVDRYHQQKIHPAAQLERDSRNGYLQALKALRLDVEAVEGLPGRPMGS